MSDLQLTDPDPTEEAALRVLLHRAVDDLEIPPYEPAPPGVVELDRHRSRRTPWLAAAAVLVLVAGGLAWWSSAQGDDNRVDSGPASTEMIDGLARVVGQPGIWRLPDAASELEVTRAVESPRGLPTGQFLAVDDLEDPTKLLMIAPAGYIVDTPGATPPEPFVGGATLSTLTTEPGATWTQVAAADGAGYLAAVSVGIEQDEVVALLRTMVEGFGESPVSLTNMNRFADLLRAVALPGGVEPLWDDDSILESIEGTTAEGGPARTLALFLDDRGEADGLGISMLETGLRGAVARRWTEIYWSLPAMGTTFRSAPELGPGVLSGMVDGVPTAMVVTDDGTQIVVGRTGLGGETVVASPVDPLSIEEQLEMIATLRSMPEAELRSQLRDAGAPLEPARGPDDSGG